MLRATLRLARALLAAAQARAARSSRDKAEALYLLAAGALAHFAWLHAPTQAQGRVWNVSQGLLLAFALVLVARRYDWTVRIAAGLIWTWQILTAGCTLAYLWRPYAGECTGSLDYPLGMAALAASVGLAWLFYRGGRHVG